jgi:hypothetical protein
VTLKAASIEPRAPRYEHAADKSRALREVLDLKDPKAFLAKSGWYPGILLQ